MNKGNGAVQLPEATIDLSAKLLVGPTTPAWEPP